MVIRIQVKPSGNRDEVVIQPDGSYLVRTTAKPINGQANIAVVKLLANYFNKSKSQIQIKKRRWQSLQNSRYSGLVTG